MANVAERRNYARWAEQNPLALALIASLFIHVGLYGTWRVGQHLGWWNNQPAWLAQITRKLAQAAAREQKPKPPQETTIPMTFVEIDPQTAIEEAPENAKYYSSKNSKAANPDPKNEPVPKIDGHQELVPRLMDNEKPQPKPLQPSPAPEPPKPPEPKPQTDTVGDLALSKPREQKETGDQPDPPKDRPRTLAQARQKAMIGTLDRDEQKQLRALLDKMIARDDGWSANY